MFTQDTLRFNRIIIISISIDQYLLNIIHILSGSSHAMPLATRSSPYISTYYTYIVYQAYTVYSTYTIGPIIIDFFPRLMNFSVQDESVGTVKKFQPRNTEVGDSARLMCSKSSEILRRTGAVQALRTHPVFGDCMDENIWRSGSAINFRLHGTYLVCCLASSYSAPAR